MTTRQNSKRLRIGLVISHLYGSYGEKLWPTLESTARERDIDLIFFPGDALRAPYGQNYQEEIVYDLATPKHVDGFIIAAGTLCNFLDPGEFRGYFRRFDRYKAVTLGIQMPGHPGILVDNAAGVRETVNHLVRTHGYKRFVYITGSETNKESQDRFRAFEDTLREHKIRLNPDFILHGDFTQVTGFKLLSRLIRDHGTDFDAIVTANDNTAQGVLEALEEKKISVPRDVAVAGFDNIDEVRFHPYCPLTTVAQPIREQAIIALDLLLDMIAGKDVQDSILLPTRLVIRSSCGCKPDAMNLTEGAGETRRKKGAKPEPIPADPDAAKIAIWLKRLLTAFRAKKRKSSDIGSLLMLIEETINNDIRLDTDISYWQEIISQFQKKSGQGSRTRLFVDKARVLISEKLQLQQGRLRLMNNFQIETLMLNLVLNISTVFSLDRLLSFIPIGFPRLDIRSCYISLYPEAALRRRTDTDWDIPDRINLVMAYDERGPIALPPGGIRYRSSDILPPEFLESDRRRTLIVKSLYFQEEQFGFIIMELGWHNGIIYTTLQNQVSSSLKGAQLFHAQEIAEHKLQTAYDQLRITNEKLQELDRAKSDFFANVSHELRTPLTLILGPVQSIVNGDFGDRTFRKEDELFQLVLINGMRLMKLINNLLDFSKVEAGRMTVRKKSTVIPELLKYYVSTVKSAADNRKLSLTFENRAEGLVSSVDRELLEKAVFNLISNAFKFTPDGGRITIRLQSGGGEFSIEVSDTGPGIPEEKFGAIFERFGQAGTATARKFQGTGIGLALTKEIVELHGGRIGVRSRVGEGSTFTITLPVQKSDEPERSGVIEDFGEIDPYLLTDMTERLHAKPVGLSRTEDIGKTILIADDHPDMRKFLRSILEQFFRVVDAENGRRAMEKALKNPPDLIVSDVMMPEMDGYELCQRVKNSPTLAQVPVILITARADISTKLQGLQHKADDYLAKPFNSKELIARINNLLENRGLQIELSRRQKEIEKDFDQAALVQKTVLTPRESYTAIPGFDMDVRYIPMNGRISGDFYSISRQSNGSVSVMVADVAGHGIQAALSTMQIDILNRETAAFDSPKRRLEYINDILTRMSASKNFFTGFLANITDNTIRYASAGHPPQFLIRAGTADIVPLKTHGKIIGMLPDCDLEEKSETMNPGDILLLFTDGIYEQFDARGQEFGEAGLQAVIRRTLEKIPDITMGNLNSAIQSRLMEFLQNKPVDDDITLIALRMNRA